MNTLEPINPIQRTPYGAIIIDYDVMCTPTSLCTWSVDENGSPKPVVYCQKPEHTLNPICQQTNRGIDLIGCYAEPTCGGIVSNARKTKDILRKKPHYINIIKEEEKSMKQLKRKRQKEEFTNHVLLISITVCLALIVIALLLYAYSKRRRYSRRKRQISQNLKRPTSRKISPDVGKIVKPLNK